MPIDNASKVIMLLCKCFSCERKQRKVCRGLMGVRDVLNFLFFIFNIQVRSSENYYACPNKRNPTDPIKKYMTLVLMERRFVFLIFII